MTRRFERTTAAAYDFPRVVPHLHGTSTERAYILSETRGITKDKPMHSPPVEPWTHDHVFLGHRHSHNERRIWLVVALTCVMMAGEIAAGTVFGSMALLADGWHMATHAAALGIAAVAYLFARQHAGNPRFAFGTGKFGDLAAFASAIILAIIAVQVAYESAVRLVHPVPIAY